MDSDTILTLCFTSYCVAAVLGALVAALLEIPRLERQRPDSDREGGFRL